jgi:murein DD-endopeptidase MepM/ murein hydrolase activator NlpD
VLAATDGPIIKLFNSERGGITLYQRGPEGRLIYYYAHLDRYADGIAEGKEIRRGEVIAYVGNTGNAGPENYHLHFAIWVPADPSRYWDGIPVNPYPILRRSARSGDGSGAPGKSLR